MHFPFRKTALLAFLLINITGVCQESPRIIFLKQQLSRHAGSTAAIRLCYDLSLEYSRPATFQQDSAIAYISQALDLSKTQQYDALLFDIRLQYARLLEVTGNYSIAMEYLFANLEMLDRKHGTGRDTLKDQKNRLFLYGGIANDYVGLSNYEKALEYYHKIRRLLESLRSASPPQEYTGEMQILLNNIGSVYLSQYQFDSALVYLRGALSLNSEEGNPAYLAGTLNNIGIIFKEKKQYDSSFLYYTRALGIRQELGDLRGIAQIRNNLGDYYMLRGNYPQAIRELTEALEMSRKTGALQSQMKAANFLSDAFAKTGDLRQALEMQKLYKLLSDSIINIDNIKRTTQLEMQYQFDRKEQESLLAQHKALAEKEFNTLVMSFIAGILLLGMVIAFLLYFLQRNKTRRSRMELEFRNRELTTHVMYLLQKNEFIISVSKKLMQFKDKLTTEDRKQLLDIARELQSNVDKTVWEEFEMRFQNVHHDFYTNLNRKFPDLTPNELKICAFLRLNMTTKDISSITFQSTKSLLVARTRLRKKMGIDRDENLVSFLQQF